MDINYWYLAILVATLVYIIPVLIIRVGIDRRQNDRRVCVQMVEVERRQGSRRG